LCGDMAKIFGEGGQVRGEEFPGIRDESGMEIGSVEIPAGTRRTVTED
jgi:hypothetical protein